MLAEPLIQKVAPSSCSGKHLILLPLLLGVAAIVSLPRMQYEEPAVSMALVPQLSRSRMHDAIKRWHAVGAPTARSAAMPMGPVQMRTYAMVDSTFPMGVESRGGYSPKRKAIIKARFKKRPKETKPTKKDYGLDVMRPPPREVLVVTEAGDNAEK
eukprot:gnl/TRDRNA2_/TRDRNA2_35498_c0_seq1.p1 gnl/TRDRNA2_/TRDRNA2_35498_c0~~gnl/TRDRNA2_/TRDRNA2_35498_c0_seq1.p1  ORF type:complete len:156 (+),score=25.89 gnl/TRDRNA2_/TRDRNA2_35498_c0_seq1:81-548(+)